MVHSVAGNPFECWVEERQRNVFGMRFRVEEILFNGKSEFQKVDVIKSAGHGRMLFIDGLVMVSERDEFIYHDMIAHVPLFTHPNPRRVLVIGGGDGGTVREVVRHKSVERCVMVEIDQMVIDASKQFLPFTSSSLDDPRVELMCRDGVQFMAETDERFDVVLIDSTDPIGPAQPLFGETFYRNVSRVLNDDGIVVAQGESPFHDLALQRSILGNLIKSFKQARPYNYANLTYPTGLWSFLFASKGLCPLNDFDPERVAASGLSFRYYNADIHRAAFALPQLQVDELKDLLK